MLQFKHSSFICIYCLHLKTICSLSWTFSHTNNKECHRISIKWTPRAMKSMSNLSKKWAEFSHQNLKITEHRSVIANKYSSFIPHLTSQNIFPRFWQVKAEYNNLSLLLHVESSYRGMAGDKISTIQRFSQHGMIITPQQMDVQPPKNLHLFAAIRKADKV